MAIHVGVTAVIIMLIMPIIYFTSLAILGTSIRGPRGGDLVEPTLTVSTAASQAPVNATLRKKKCV